MRFNVERIRCSQSVTGLLEARGRDYRAGALDVFNGEMTIGALIAFNMLAGRVSNPLVQMVTMVHEYQNRVGC
jgi:ATP-binding cassette subfamily B protein